MQEPSTIGEALAQELIWVHTAIRRDLETIRQLAGRALDGAPPDEIRDEIAELQTNSPLWKLRVNCLYYCRVVHTHHSIEDRQLFPALRRSKPSLAPVVDRLEADHRQVSDQLDEVEAAVDSLIADDSAEGRKRVVDALQLLSDHLLAHLDFEEKSIIPTMREWGEWPQR